MSCEAKRGLSHRFVVIYLFVYLRKLFSKIATPPKIVDGFECGFFYINLQGFNSSGCAYVSNRACISTSKKYKKKTFSG